ncbi:hypothetical protein [Achromobacter animicus]|uniref:hypothetical protein n=1 Tax=Achromobacter animicus TaxID=1389935 RepID=UPI0028AFA3DF|nr:hypothetical protein [Achromobacter animicus]
MSFPKQKVEKRPEGAFSVKAAGPARLPFVCHLMLEKSGERRGRPKQNPGSGRNRGNQSHIVVNLGGNCKPPEKTAFSAHFGAVTH